MSTTLFGVTLGNLQALIFIPLCIALLVIAWWSYKKRRALITLLSGSRSAMFSQYSVTKDRIKFLLKTIGFIFLFFALLHPQWGKKEEVVIQEGRDILIALDISRSMLAQDLKPNRLEFAKAKIKKLLSMIPSERVGLMLFAGDTFVQCPLTKDHAAFYMFLDAVDAESISSGTTALDNAIFKALGIFKQMKERKNKLFVMLTDGEDFSSSLADVKKQAQDMHLTIFTLGVGTPEGAPVPVLDAHGRQIGVQKDTKGSVVISRLNEGILRTLAEDTGGVYLSITPSDDDLKTLVNYVRKYEKERFEDTKVARLEEQYPYFLAVSLLAFLIEWML